MRKPSTLAFLHRLRQGGATLEPAKAPAAHRAVVVPCRVGWFLHGFGDPQIIQLSNFNSSHLDDLECYY